MAAGVYRRIAALACIISLILHQHPLSAEKGAPAPGEKYDLELNNGSVLKGAVFREQKAGADYFDVPGIGERLKIQGYKIAKPSSARPWRIAAGIAALAPLDQPSLGFTSGLQFDILGAVSLWAASAAAFPQLAVRTGFVRLSGDKAILSGPEVSAGPLWQIALDGHGRHNLSGALFAGSGFYELLNRNIESKFTQTTFIASAQLGYLYRSGQWGYALSYTHTYFYDTNLPLHTGGVALAVTYFNEDL